MSCKYCNSPVRVRPPIVDYREYRYGPEYPRYTNDVYVEVEDGGNLYVETSGDMCLITRVPVKFCPMCGRGLS